LHESLREKAPLFDRERMRRVIRRMAGEIVERNSGVEGLLLVGIRTRGVPLSERLAAEIERAEGAEVERGVLDITLYRDDLSTIAPQPVVKETTLPPLDGKTVVLCDDVLYTGRTVRAALDHLADYGRPRSVQLAVLIDRGLRELPIQADFAGETLTTTPDEVVEVAFPETDGDEGVRLMEKVER
jgi:pyrimidine operon attenuation protein/uracil phosphoribosyltransferase